MAWVPRARIESYRAMSKRLTLDQIAERASRREDVSAYFTNKFTVVRPIRRVNVDLTEGMLRELDEKAAALNISHQAAIQTLLGRALEQERKEKRAPKKPV